MSETRDPTPIKSKDLPWGFKITNVVTAGSATIFITLVGAIFAAGGIYVSQANDRRDLHKELAALQSHLDDAAKQLAEQTALTAARQDDALKAAEQRHADEMRGVYSRFDRIEGRVDELANRPWPQKPYAGHQ